MADAALWTRLVMNADVTQLCALAPDQRFDALGGSPNGLVDDEVALRRAIYGANVAEAAGAHRWPSLLAANFIHPLALLLWFGAVMAFAARSPQLGAAIVAVVVINGAFAFLQERRAERVVEALLSRAAVSARVVRAGGELTIPAADLVPGDVVLLAAGEVVPADCILVQADAIALDLSLLTGETAQVTRSAEVDARTGVDVAHRRCFAPAAAGVVRGTATTLVATTGRASTLGRIETLLVAPGRGKSLLERQVGELSRLAGVIAVVCGVATLTLAIALKGTGIVVALTFATGVIVALVPEGLLPLLTVSLAMVARRMAARGALVRRLAAIEIVGASTVICTDKTGTLTQNTLDVLAFVPAPDADDAEPRARAIAALCNDACDPIDRALGRWAGAGGISIELLRAQHPRLGGAPFDAYRRYMRVDCAFSDGARQLIKGAPEAIEALVGRPLPSELAATVSGAARRGERVLLLAEGQAAGPVRYVGVLRLHDPPRPEVPAAIASCRRAGIRVVMLTGDHPATACAIAKQVGLADEGTDVLEGDALASLDDHELVTHLRGGAILARTTPEQKLRVVRALRAAGEVVTVTGDGVNDAPALRLADVGIAMGQRGTEVAKQASDIVLLDENFATIVAAIEEGRAVKENIRRFASYVFTSNVAELVPFLCYVFLAIPLPLTILQVLAIDLGTDLLPALALGLEPASPRTLDRPPEPPRTRLLTRALAVRTFLWFGLIEAALAMLAFSAGRPATGTTLTFLGIVGGQIGCVLAQRDGGLRARLSPASNPWIWLGIALETAVAVALVYVPRVHEVFDMVPVSLAWFALLPGCAFVLVAADELRRRASASRWRAVMKKISSAPSL